MAVHAACANGNFTSASTWETVDSTSYNNSESANSALSTSQVSSSTFTPGAITIDGIGVKLASRAASPSGTITVQLTQGGSLVSGTNVTINVSDLPTCTATSGTTTPVATAEGGWVFFKFAVPVLLTAATAYAVSAATSVSSQVNLWSASGTNWSRYLRTTTTGAPSAGDDVIITGEWTAAATVTARTVTMDSTASTAYGSNTTTQVTPAIAICNSGTLSYGTSASTAYQLVEKGYIIVYNGGTMNIGTSGTPIPSTSTATLQMTCTADGDFGIVIRNGGTFNAYGVARTSGKNVVQTFLTANLSSSGTSATVNDDTGWLSGDVVCLAPTAATYNQYEKVTLNANATSSGLSFSAGVSNAHSGTAPTQGEVGLLTRNVVFTGASTSVQPFFYSGNTATTTIQWAEFNQFGSGASQGNFKDCISLQTTTGSFSLTYSSIHDCRSSAIYASGSTFNNMTIQNVVIYNFDTNTVSSGHGIYINNATSGTNWTIDHTMVCGQSASSFSNAGIYLSDVGGSLTNVVVTGVNYGNGILILAEAATLGTFTNVTVHSNNSGSDGAIQFASSPCTGTINGGSVYRNNGYGVAHAYNNGPSIYSPDVLTLKNMLIFGNGSGCVLLNNTGSYVYDNCTMAGDTSFSCNNVISSLNAGTTLRFYSCTISPTSGIYVPCTYDFNVSYRGTVDIFLDNCLFRSGSTPVWNGALGSASGPLVKFQNFNQVSNDNRVYFSNDTLANWPAVIQTDTGTVYGTNSRSEKMTPGGYNVSKFQSASIYVACPSGKAATPIVQVQKNAAYNGNAPRLMLRRQDSMGVTSDTVVATFSASSGVWQALTGTTSAAPQDGVFEFYVDCDGTASTGSVWVGDATATVA